MMSCNSEEHQYQDARLNKVYLRLLAKLAVQDKAVSTPLNSMLAKTRSLRLMLIAELGGR